MVSSSNFTLIKIMVFTELGFLYPNCISNTHGVCICDFTQYMCIHKCGGGGICLSLLDLYCKSRRLLQHFQNSFLLKLINNSSKVMLQRILQVTSVNQLRCLIFTDIYKFIIVMAQVIVWTHKLKKIRKWKNVCLLSWIGEQTNLLQNQS